ncbi:MAG TPA: SCO family protein [Phycisphaerae bacterium]|nr:SCO family protein [Phycisphaerae bacterium]
MLNAIRHNFRKSLRAALAAAAFVAAPVLTAPTALAQYRMDTLPPGTGQDMSMPRITDKAGAQLPLDDQFTNTDGKTVTLGSLFNHEKPVILSLVYFSCPLMCGETQNQIARSVVDSPGGLKPGKDYDIVVVSIDPDDTPDLARQKQNHYLDMMNLKPGDPALTYLIGKEDNIKRLADAAGFGYRRNFGPVSDKFVHQPGLFICTPDGKVSHTIAGLTFDNNELYSSLRTASNGKIGSGFAALAISCGAMRYNPHTGHYEANPFFWVGTATGLVTILMLGGFLTMMWRTDVRLKSARANEAKESPPNPERT